MDTVENAGIMVTISVDNPHWFLVDMSARLLVSPGDHMCTVVGISVDNDRLSPYFVRLSRAGSPTLAIAWWGLIKLGVRFSVIL